MRGDGLLILLLATAGILFGCPAEPDYERWRNPAASPTSVVNTPSPTPVVNTPTPTPAPTSVTQTPQPTPTQSQAPTVQPTESPTPSPTPSLSPSPTPGLPPIVGTWLSEGSDIAGLLRNPPVGFVRIDATFEANGDYTVNARNDQSQSFSFTGTYTVNLGSLPATIVLMQQTPEVSRSEGIWVVQGNTLTYEVSQVQPPLNGVTAPTPEGGFGSTSNGAFDNDNIQTYQRQQ